MSEARFAFDPLGAASALERMARAPAGAVTMAGEAWAQGAMGALVHAELLAAQAGIVPWFEMPDGSRGVLTIGAARERIDDAPEDVRTLYLATHGIVRSTHASAAPASGTAPALGGMDDELGDPTTLIVAVTVVAIAAIIGTAWYFTRRSEIEVEGRNVRTTALAAEASRLAAEQLEKTGRIDPGVWEVFKSIAETEAGSPWVPVALAGIAVAGGIGGFVAWRRWRGREGVRA